MKKVSAFIFAVLMLFTCASCASEPTQEDAVIIAFYSVKSAQGEFIVEVQDLGGVYSELYDKDGIYIRFADEEVVFDKEGNKLKREDLAYGDTLEIHYNGKLQRKNPKTIKAFKVIKAS